MLNKIDEFLKTNEPIKISLEDLAKEIGENPEVLNTFLSEYGNYKESKELNHFFIKKDYYINGVRSEDSFAHLNKEATKKVIELINRYPKNEENKNNILLTQLLEGLPVFKGAVDDSDIGGLYSSVFTKFGEYGERITEFSEMPIDELLNYLPNIDFTLRKNQNNYYIKIEELEITECSNSFFGAFVKAITELSKKKDFFIVQVSEKYIEEDEDPEEVEESNPFEFSPVFFNEEEAKNWIDSMKSTKYRESHGIVFKIIKTN